MLGLFFSSDIIIIFLIFPCFYFIRIYFYASTLPFVIHFPICLSPFIILLSFHALFSFCTTFITYCFVVLYILYQCIMMRFSYCKLVPL